MIDLEAQRDIHINASPEAVYEIVCDLTRHSELAGSGEVLRIRKLTDGPTGIGTLIEADESLNLGGEQMDFTATSVVVTCTPPTTVSWLAIPPFPLRRIQWWYHLAPEDGGTRVRQEVEVDLGDAREAMGGTEGYRSTRGVVVIQGMEKTLENLRKVAEG